MPRVLGRFRSNVLSQGDQAQHGRVWSRQAIRWIMWRPTAANGLAIAVDRLNSPQPNTTVPSTAGKR
jgi:hypothetical protein